MDFQQIRKYVKGVLTNSFLNKTTLDKLSTSDEGNLLFNGKGINSSSIEWNQIQTEGIKIAEVTIDGMTTEIFAPNGIERSGIVVDTLIDATITTTGSYDLSASIDNYDMLIVTGMTHINNSDYEQLNSLTIMKDDYYIEAVDGWSHSINFSISGSTRRAVFNFNGGKLNVVKIENAVLKKIYGIKFISTLHEYSTEEQIVGTWVDGKPLYEKTFKTTVNVTGSTEYFSSVIVEDAENYFIENAFCTENENGTGAIQMIGSVNFNGNYDYNITSFNLNTGRWWIIRGGSTSPYTTIIVRYTKTTD